MNCDEVLEAAPFLHSNELDACTALEIEQHLRGCSQCRRNIAQERALDQFIRQEMTREPIDTSRIEQNVRRAMTTQSHRKLIAMAAIAAMVLLAVAGYQGMIRSRSNEIYSAAARDHQREIVNRQPRKWQTDPAAIQQIVDHQGITASDIQRLAPAGYHLAEGRLCMLSGQIFVHLVYASGDNRFSLFLRRKKAQLESGKPYSYTAEHVACVQKNGLTAVVVSNQSEESAMGLARAIQSEM